MRMRQKNATGRTMLDFMLAMGKEISQAEYKELSNTPIRIKKITQFFRTWERMMKYIANEFPEDYEKLGNIEKTPKEEPKPKTKPKVAPKPARTVEKKKDEKDI